MEKEKILGVLYGMAMGDAMGMPPELWSRKRLLDEYGKITDFLDGHPDNIISYQYKRGNFTDDTSQALVTLDSLIETNFIPNRKNIAKHILKWAKDIHAEENNILGPTSKLVLKLIEEDKDPSAVSDEALTNGAAMRIAPVGALFYLHQWKELCDYVSEISKTTHSSDITITGACMIAMAVCSAMERNSREEMLQNVLKIESYAMSLGASTVSPSLTTRIKYGISLADQYSEDEDRFLEELYNMMGCGVNTADSIPCAIVIAYYCWGNSWKCALLCANLGGDTDTIGAMATAICGAVNGINNIPEKAVKLLKEANHIDFNFYAEEILKRRGKLC